MDDENSSTPSTPPEDRPVGSGDYVVQPGDCLASIASANGFFWQTLWNDPGNAELKQKRKSPFLLFPGDRVTVPPLRSKQDPAASEQRHKYKIKGVPALVRLQIMEEPDPQSAPGQAPGSQNNEDGAEVVVEEPPEEGLKLQPARNKPYNTLIDDVAGPSGQTDGDGMLKVQIMPQAKKLSVRLEPGTNREREFVLLLGQLNPVDTRSGQAQRLTNLGYEVDPSDDDPDSLEAALEQFQQSQGLQPTGKADSTTLNKLKELHGS